jgi:hypothetical protein
MNGLSIAIVVAAWTLSVAIGMVALGAGLFALAMWWNQAADRFFHMWDVRRTAARLVGDIYCAHFRYRAGHDVTGGARRELG